MDYLKKIYDLKKVKDLLVQLKNLTHAVILYSKDDIFLQCFAKLLILKDVCQTSEICFDCVNCKKVLNGNSVDVEYFGFQKNIVVEDSQQIIADSYVVPLEFKNKYFVVNNIDKATVSSQNKLLKIIEEPQSFDRYIFLTKNVDEVLPTIKSRCQVISLPKFTADELMECFEYKVNDAKHFTTSVVFADGNLAKLQEIYSDPNYMELYNLALNILTNMLNSSMVLQYSSKILSYKGELQKFLDILNLFFADMLCIKQNKKDLIANKQLEQQLQVLANAYSSVAIVAILNYINGATQKLNYNVSTNAFVDNLLLKILEIKFICK